MRGNRQRVRDMRSASQNITKKSCKKAWQAGEACQRCSPVAQPPRASNTMKKRTSKNSALSFSRLLACLLCLLGFLLALLGITDSLATKSLAQGTSNSSAASVQVGASYHNDVSPPLRDMPASTEADLRRGGDRD